MGILVCSRCMAKTKATSIEDGRKRLDHGIGLYIGKPCGDGRAELFFTGADKVTEPSKKMIGKKSAKSKSD